MKKGLEENRNISVLKDCTGTCLGAAFVLFVVMIINLCVFILYDLPLEPFLYGGVLGLIAFLIYSALVYFRKRKKAKGREELYKRAAASYHDLISREIMENPDFADRDYERIIRILDQRIMELEGEFENSKADMEDYYSTWVHQIKTPIAVMRMLLAEDTKENRTLGMELFRIEQYVEMALVYIRLEAHDNDLVIKEYDLDELVRTSVRKFAMQFIGRKLTMDFKPTGKKLVTDRKWFGTIMDQILSNAVKYTMTGGVRIYMRDERTLCIQDTGIGIAKEDIPRVFEKGYTGQNGRSDEKSSGLGLYLCKKAAEKVNIGLALESEPQQGTTFLLTLNQEGQRC